MQNHTLAVHAFIKKDGSAIILKKALPPKKGCPPKKEKEEKTVEDMLASIVALDQNGSLILLLFTLENDGNDEEQEDVLRKALVHYAGKIVAVKTDASITPVNWNEILTMIRNLVDDKTESNCCINSARAFCFTCWKFRYFHGPGSRVTLQSVIDCISGHCSISSSSSTYRILNAEDANALIFQLSDGDSEDWLLRRIEEWFLALEKECSFNSDDAFKFILSNSTLCNTMTKTTNFNSQIFDAIVYLLKTKSFTDDSLCVTSAENLRQVLKFIDQGRSQWSEYYKFVSSQVTALHERLLKLLYAHSNDTTLFNTTMSTSNTLQGCMKMCFRIMIECLPEKIVKYAKSNYDQISTLPPDVQCHIYRMAGLAYLSLGHLHSASYNFYRVINRICTVHRDQPLVMTLVYESGLYAYLGLAIFYLKQTMSGNTSSQKKLFDCLHKAYELARPLKDSCPNTFVTFACVASLVLALLDRIDLKDGKEEFILQEFAVWSHEASKVVLERSDQMSIFPLLTGQLGHAWRNSTVKKIRINPDIMMLANLTNSWSYDDEKEEYSPISASVAISCDRMMHDKGRARAMQTIFSQCIIRIIPSMSQRDIFVQDTIASATAAATAAAADQKLVPKETDVWDRLHFECYNKSKSIVGIFFSRGKENSILLPIQHAEHPQRMSIFDQLLSHYRVGFWQGNNPLPNNDIPAPNDDPNDEYFNDWMAKTFGLDSRNEAHQKSIKALIELSRDFTPDPRTEFETIVSGALKSNTDLDSNFFTFPNSEANAIDTCRGFRESSNAKANFLRLPHFRVRREAVFRWLSWNISNSLSFNHLLRTKCFLSPAQIDRIINVCLGNDIGLNISTLKNLLGLKDLILNGSTHILISSNDIRILELPWEILASPLVAKSKISIKNLSPNQIPERCEVESCQIIIQREVAQVLNLDNLPFCYFDLLETIADDLTSKDRIVIVGDFSTCSATTFQNHPWISTVKELWILNVTLVSKNVSIRYSNTDFLATGDAIALRLATQLSDFGVRQTIYGTFVLLSNNLLEKRKHIAPSMTSEIHAFEMGNLSQLLKEVSNPKKISITPVSFNHNLSLRSIIPQVKNRLHSLYHLRRD
jgi:hypothetical protein